MNRLVELIARLLEREERTAVLGDLMETNESGARALAGVAGLVLRRQAALWMDCRPWVALIGVVGVVCPFLFIVLAELIRPLTIDVVTYWRMGSLFYSGLTVGEQFCMSASGAVGLFVWSWTSGFVMSRLAGRTLWMIGTLYFLPWIVPWVLPWVSATRPLAFALAALHSALCLCLIVYPSIRGLQRGRSENAVTTSQAFCLASTVLCVIGLTTWMGGWPAAAITRWAGGEWDASPGWSSRLLFHSVLAWPALYLLFTARRRSLMGPVPRS